LNDTLTKQNYETKKTLDHLKQTLSMTKMENAALAQQKQQRSTLTNYRKNVKSRGNF